MTRRVGVVADDLTGASDAAVQFARLGWPTLVTLTNALETRSTDVDSVVAATTDARAAESSVAYEGTAEAVRDMLSTGTDRLLVKVDSTMRGSVAAQLAGAVQAWSEQHAGAFVVLCPAYPAMGRTVTQGEVRINGDLLEASAPGQDPVTPVRSSVMSDLVPGSTHVTSAGHDTDELVRDIRRAAIESSVVTVDAVTQDDLHALAEAVARIGPLAVPAGSAGLAEALAARWRGDGGLQPVVTQPGTATRRGPTLVLVTSLNDTARTQLRCLTQQFGTGVVVTEPEIDDLIDDDRFATWRSEQLSRAVPGHGVVLVRAPDERSSAMSAAGQVAHRLADVVADLHGKLDFSAVVVTGGDGARALVKRWRCTGIAVHDALREGMPHGVLVGGEVDGLPIVTKAGGFGAPDALVFAVRHLQARDSDTEPIRQATHFDH
jgi:uncharacterized protein YgbK (DUF1537 family)